MTHRRAPTKASDPGRDAWTLLFELLRARPVLDAVSDEFGLSASQVSLLHALEPTSATAMASLARTLSCHDSNVTGLVDKLEKRGLVERRGDPTDRRVKLIALTAEGLGLRAQILARLFDPPAFVEQLDVADKRALRDILRRATERMESSK